MFKRITAVLASLLLVIAAQAQPELGRPRVGSSVIYEVNVRQFTQEGTFDAFRAHIPRLAEMGVDILWLMPIHPISEKHRKGTLGSYYAPADYTEVNPEFGTKEDFDELVRDAHDAGMIVLLDWVANHTGWDHVWTETNPEYYRQNEAGEFITPNGDWLDVIQLDMEREDTRKAMKEAMLYWVREHDVDGFRCDVAELVPADFWRDAISDLREERDVFMLAEGAAAWLYDCGFDATYGWGLGDACLRVVNDGRPAFEVMDSLRDATAQRRHPRRPFRMHFTTNHDWNSWNGTAVERLGEAWEAATVLTFMAPGMPLIYSGQEAGLDAQLAFFEKDAIAWREHPARELYTRLARFKERVPALDAGDPSSVLRPLIVHEPDRLIAFERRIRGSRVLVFVNLSDRPVSVLDPPSVDIYRDLDGEPAEYPTALPAWGWVVLEVAQ
ncbi:MAG: alpha-amylase family glycosyl hydrolase [Phycisphaerales bacterium]